MAIKIVINGEAVTLPDLPAELLASHPYAYIRYHWGENTQADEVYLTMVSVPVQFDPSQDALVAEGANYVTHIADVDQWVEVESGDSFSVCEDVADYALSWANFDVLTLGSDDLYFADSTAAGPAAAAGMRYITDDNGRLLYVSFGADIVCDGQSCTGYTGSVPTGYASLEAWYLAQADQLHKWAVVAGELTLDDTAAAPATDKTPMYWEDFVEAPAWEPIWKNATPSADFAAQTLTIEGLGKYNTWLVIAKEDTETARQVSVIVHAQESEDTVKGALTQASTNTNLYAWNRERNFTITRSANTIYFTTGYKGGASAGSNAPSAMIPLYIYGSYFEEATT